MISFASDDNKEQTPIDKKIDARFLACPMPLLKAKQALNQMQKNQVLEVLATDAGSWKDFHQLVLLCQYQLLCAEQNQQEFRYVIKK